MTPNTRPSRVAEWAELVGDPVPDGIRDADSSAGSLPAEVRPTDDRWVATRSPDGQ